MRSFLCHDLYRYNKLRHTLLGFFYWWQYPGPGRRQPHLCHAVVILGAVTNVVLDYLFIFRFHMGMAGAAWATVIGQVVSSLMIVRYFFRFKTPVDEKTPQNKGDLYYRNCITGIGLL